MNNAHKTHVKGNGLQLSQKWFGGQGWVGGVLVGWLGQGGAGQGRARGWGGFGQVRVGQVD